MRNHLIAALADKAKYDEKVMLLVGDLGYSVVEGFANQFPNRFINCGIAEENMLSVAAGLAMEGRKVFAYSIGNFPTLRCMEQIRNDICYHNLDVNILGVGGGFTYGVQGVTHHATEEIGAMRLLPHMRVYAPADVSEALAVLDEVCAMQEPSYIRLGGGHDKVFHGMPRVDISTGIIPFADMREGTGADYAVIVTMGTMLDEGFKLSKFLEAHHISHVLYSCPRIKPISTEAVLQAVARSKLVVTMEEHNVIGGLGSAIAEILAEIKCTPILLRIGLEDEFSSIVGDRDFLRRSYGMDARMALNKILEVWEKRERN